MDPATDRGKRQNNHRNRRSLYIPGSSAQLHGFLHKLQKSNVENDGMDRKLCVDIKLFDSSSSPPFCPDYNTGPRGVQSSFAGADSELQKENKDMIYTIEKRHEFGGGTMETHYEVRSYTHITPIGVYAGGKTLKAGTKRQCEKFCRIKGIAVEEKGE